MVDMRSLVLFLAFTISTSASPSPWSLHFKHYRYEHDHHKPSFSTSAPTSLPTSHSGAPSNSFGSAPYSSGQTNSTGTGFPTFSFSASGTGYPTLTASASGTGFSTPPGPASSGTAPASRNTRIGSGTGINTIPGTTVGTSSSASYSVRPTGSANSTSLYASSGIAPKSSSTPSAGTGNVNATEAAATSASQSKAAGTPCPDFLRGVNIGGWLLLDSTLNAKLLSAADAKNQWAFDSVAGAQEKLSGHWDTYFQEADVAVLKSHGINAIKIPIGYWAFDNTGTPYKKGADAYLEKAIGWASAAGLKVWIDLSNTDSSSTTFAEVSSDQAVSHSLSILTTVAKKYCSAQYASTVTAIQIFSAPISLPQADANTLDSFAKQAFSTVKTAAAENPNLQVIMPDAASSPGDMQPLASSCSSTKGLFAVAESMSELTCPCEQQMTQAQHIQDACSRGYAMAGLNHDKISIYVGDFNPATNATMNVEGWTDDVVTDVRKYVEAQLDVFEAYTSGYFFWSWALETEEVAGVGWGFKAGVEKGYIPNPLNDPSQRKYPGLCDA